MSGATAAAAGAALELEALRVRHARGAAWALDGVTLRVEPGELLALVGPSGSGKSTLLRAVAGLVQPEAGQVRLGGRRIDTLPPAERDVALVFQHHALFPHLSVLENIALGLRARRVPDAEARARAAAERLGLGALLARRPAQLSGGERQRVALGRALVRAPSLFLLDEPFSSLDGPLRVALREELVRLHEGLGAGMVLVTHDPAEALGLGRRVGVLVAGRLEQVGAPEALYRRPASLAVARLVGAPPALVPARPEGPHALRLPFGTLALPPALHAAVARAPAPLQVGVRPEDVALGGAAAPYAARVERVEFLGDRREALLALEGARLRARLAPGVPAPAPGEAVRVALDTDALLLFAGEGAHALERTP